MHLAVLAAAAAAAVVSPPAAVVTGTSAGVDVYRAGGAFVGAFDAYPPGFRGGVRVGLGDLVGNGEREIVTAPGAGIEPEVDVWSVSGARLARFDAYEPEFRGGIDVAVGDVVGNGAAQIVTAPGPERPPTVRVFDASGRQLSSFSAFADSYRGGVSVAAGDLDGDGRAEIVVGTLTPPARIKVFTGDGRIEGGMDVRLTNRTERGVDVAVADLDGNLGPEVLVGQASGPAPVLAVVDPIAATVLRELVPAPAAANGIRVAAGDLDGEGRDEVLVAPAPGGDGSVRVLDSRLTQRGSFRSDGFDIAAPARLGLPIRAYALTAKAVAHRRTSVVVARFYDVARTRVNPVTATLVWRDGTVTAGTVAKQRGLHWFEVRASRRFARAGSDPVTVTLTDGAGRRSIAHSTVLVRKS